MPFTADRGPVFCEAWCNLVQSLERLGEFKAEIPRRVPETSVARNAGPLRQPGLRAVLNAAVTEDSSW